MATGRPPRYGGRVARSSRGPSRDPGTMTLPRREWLRLAAAGLTLGGWPRPSALAGPGPACYAAIEQACLDACGRATGRRLCELLGGPVRDPVEFAAYLFYRYPADHPTVLADPHLVDSRGKGGRALDAWGEVRTPEAMAAMAKGFRDRWGFRVFKLKAGVLAPDAELETIRAMA